MVNQNQGAKVRLIHLTLPCGAFRDLYRDNYSTHQPENSSTLPLAGNAPEKYGPGDR